ncbi:hypothetical protein [Paracoccus mutanolyticus]|uniref:hypothetical protein n=1 Tax=Paracoccus mutanolyticus TaxID=1499308 RepID=UPI0011AE4AF6|nr:hypothetical protein [Paracoccus mutanolyticus]
MGLPGGKQRRAVDQSTLTRSASTRRAVSASSSTLVFKGRSNDFSLFRNRMGAFSGLSVRVPLAEFPTPGRSEETEIGFERPRTSKFLRDLAPRMAYPSQKDP